MLGSITLSINRVVDSSRVIDLGRVIDLSRIISPYHFYLV